MRHLYHLPLSPFCRKVRLLLAEKKLEVDLIEEQVWEKRSDFVKQSPASKVPLLIIDDLIISESNAIFEYLEELDTRLAWRRTTCSTPICSDQADCNAMGDGGAPLGRLASEVSSPGVDEVCTCSVAPCGLDGA